MANVAAKTLGEGFVQGDLTGGIEQKQRRFPQLGQRRLRRGRSPACRRDVGVVPSGGRGCIAEVAAPAGVEPQAVQQDRSTRLAQSEHRQGGADYRVAPFGRCLGVARFGPDPAAVGQLLGEQDPLKLDRPGLVLPEAGCAQLVSRLPQQPEIVVVERVVLAPQVARDGRDGVVLFQPGVCGLDGFAGGGPVAGQGVAAGPLVGQAHQGGEPAGDGGSVAGGFDAEALAPGREIAPPAVVVLGVGPEVDRSGPGLDRHVRPGVGVVGRRQGVDRQQRVGAVHVGVVLQRGGMSLAVAPAAGFGVLDGDESFGVDGDGPGPGVGVGPGQQRDVHRQGVGPVGLETRQPIHAADDHRVVGFGACGEGGAQHQGGQPAAVLTGLRGAPRAVRFPGRPEELQPPLHRLVDPGR